MFPLHAPLTETLRTELEEYDDLTASLLARRGITSRREAELFLNPSYDLHLHDPLTMTDMRKAAERFAKAILDGEKIAAWTDYDCDGVPAATILHDFLKKVGANFENYIPHRHDEGYGVNIPGLEALAKRGVTLVVTADSGITDVAAVTRANELGMDVIVTDHHLPGEELPPAFAVVNPNARTDEPYPFKGLCGAGVAWKLCCAVLAVSPALRAKVPIGWEKWLLDMVGLATIADMVPLTGENRVLTTYGLRVLRKSPRIGLQRLCRVMRTDQSKITEDDVGFMLAPRVNAASRMGDAVEAFKLFTTTDESEADTLAKKLETLNRQRKAQAGAITRAVRERLHARTDIRSVIALGDPEWRPSMLGLVANSICEEFERPVFLWGREGNGALKGSVRSGVVHALDLMSAAVDTFEQFGGHAASGGYTVRDDAVFFLEDKLVAALSKITKAGEVSDSLVTQADAEILPHEISLRMLTQIEKLAPFGKDNPKPVFLLRDVPLWEISRFGKAQEHLKIKIAVDDSRSTIDAVTFFTKGPLARTVETLGPGSRVSVLANLERDTFSRGQPVRLRLIDMRGT